MQITGPWPFLILAFIVLTGPVSATLLFNYFEKKEIKKTTNGTIQRIEKTEEKKVIERNVQRIEKTGKKKVIERNIQETIEKKISRFLLTFFLGWIGSCLINHSNLKPQNYSSRTFSYFLLGYLTLDIYTIAASVCNFGFEPELNGERKIGYVED